MRGAEGGRTTKKNRKITRGKRAGKPWCKRGFGVKRCRGVLGFRELSQKERHLDLGFKADWGWLKGGARVHHWR
jgi:hypothetical protein